MTDTPTIVIAERYLGSPDFEARLAGDRARVISAPVDTPDQIAEATEGTVAILVTTHRLTEAHIEALRPTVRVIGRAGIGLDAIDLEAARRRGVTVYHTPDYCVDEVADQAVASILTLQRNLSEQERIARAPRWEGRSELRIRAFREAAVGVVGVGRIGNAVLTRLEPFGVRRLAYDQDPVELAEGVERCATIEDLLAAADVVTLHLPLTTETKHLLSATRIRSMRPGAYLVNLSRGPLVDTTALVAALRDGHLAGAAIDVFEAEPPDADDPLLHAPNVLLTPHFAWHSIEAEERGRTQTLEAVLDVIAGREPTDGRVAVRP